MILEDTVELQCSARNHVAEDHRRDRSDAAGPDHHASSARPHRDRGNTGEGGPRAAQGVEHRSSGGVTTIHANSAGAALSRIDQLVQEAGVPSQPQLIADSVDLIVSITRTDGGRRVEEILSVEGYEPVRGYRLRHVSRAD